MIRAWICALAIAGCGGAPVATPDAAVSQTSKMTPPCNPPMGHTYFLDTMQISTEKIFDIDGNGVADNALAFLAGPLNGFFTQSIGNGGTIYLMNFDDVAAPPLDGSTPKVRFLLGEDGDANPQDNALPDAGFVLGVEQYDVNCGFPGEVTDVSVGGGIITGEKEEFTLQVPATGSIQVKNVHLRMQLAPDLSHLDQGYVGFAWPACDMFKTPSPIAEGTMLDSILLYASLLGASPNPDVDLDHDGPEQISAAGRKDGVQMYQCTRHGQPVVSPTCPCDVIGDGYSALFQGTGVPAIFQAAP